MISKLGVPSLRDLNEGRSRVRIQRYKTGSEVPVGGDTSSSVDNLASAANAAANALNKVSSTFSAPVVSAPSAGRASTLLSQLRAKRAETTSAEGGFASFRAKDLDVTPRSTLTAAERERADRAKVDASDEAKAFAAEQEAKANRTRGQLNKVPNFNDLTPEGRQFVEDNYEHALTRARKTAVKSNVDFANRGDELVEGAALNALGARASKFGTAGFDPKRARGYLSTVVDRSVRGKDGVLTQFFGANGSNAVNSAGEINNEILSDARGHGRSGGSPLQQVIPVVSSSAAQE